jgi:hypothetical protein
MNGSLLRVILGAAALSTVSAGAALAQYPYAYGPPGTQQLLYPPTIPIPEDPMATGSVAPRAPAAAAPVPQPAPEVEVRRGCETERYDFGRSSVRVHRC